ncbi:MAG: DNA alkylation repair protein [Elusimicrobia bacterium]|nr:DNA alkylation repair protein [Elusimicrobiota bacterium]MBD3411900.1 DNA alkylation repair protein [Elusimicrobiota bacterium]
MSFVMTYKKIKQELRAVASSKKKQVLKRFFKTGPGEYGYGDIFLGVMVPQVRAIVKHYATLSTAELSTLLVSPIHEERLTGLLITVRQYQKAEKKEKSQIFSFYIKHISAANNWDLVDLSCPHIVGEHCAAGTPRILYRLARSASQWERRIAIVSTFALIRKNRFDDTLAISRMLLNDPEPLIHKAVGWMLREVGKRNKTKEKEFLKSYYRCMPRTMLRYAIERFPEKERQSFLSGRV